MLVESKKKFMINIVFVTIVLAMFYLGIKYLLPLVRPFILGFIIAFLLRRPASFISKSLNIKRRRVGVVLLATIYLLILFFLAFGGNSAYEFIYAKLALAPKKYFMELTNIVKLAFDSFKSIIPAEGKNLNNILIQVESTIYKGFNSISRGFLGSAAGVASQIPNKIVNTLFIIITSFFFLGDYDRITNFIFAQMPENTRKLVLGIKDETVYTLSNYLKAYGKIILITTIEISIGLLILRVRGAIWISFIIAIVDIIPVLGTGTTILPWAIYSFVTGNYIRGIGLLIIYGVVTVVRQIIEPKIVGKSIGLHPILTLFGMYVGTKLFGVLGLFLLPISFTVIKNLNEKGLIKIYNNLQQ